MSRLLSDSELRELLDYLIPIIREELPAGRASDKVKRAWKLLTNEDYAGELV